tara:strand:+ start:83129 stop:84001 length:873 start_codon:yes stop_codon:yes gene_type:complete
MKKLSFSLLGILMLLVISCQRGELSKQYILQLPQISVQLWSVKDELKADFVGTLTALSAMGFDGVEFAGEFGPYVNDVQGLKALLDELGLEVSGAHVRFAQLNAENLQNTLNFYRQLAVKSLVIHMDSRAWDAQLVDTFIADINALSITLKAEGFQVGYHNHWQEFNPYLGATFWDHIAQSTPNNVILQLDVGWVSYAEKNPLEFIQNYPSRTITTHIKAKFPKSITDTSNKRAIVGQDITDWAAVLKTNIEFGATKWWVIEQEESPEGFTRMQAVQASKLGLDKFISNL